MVGSNKESEKGGHFEFISFPSQKKLYIAQSEDTAQTTNKFKSILTYLKTQNPKKLKEIDASEDIPENEYYIMICCHQQMDKRCGYCGNFLVDEFKNKIANYSDCNVCFGFVNSSSAIKLFSFKLFVKLLILLVKDCDYFIISMLIGVIIEKSINFKNDACWRAQGILSILTLYKMIFIVMGITISVRWECSCISSR